MIIGHEWSAIEPPPSRTDARVHGFRSMCYKEIEMSLSIFHKCGCAACIKLAIVLEDSL